MKRSMTAMTLAIALLVVQGNAGPQSVAKIKTIEGRAGVLREGAEDWRTGKPGMPLKVGDAVYAEKESFVELVYVSGGVVRLDEKSKIIIEESTSTSTKTRTGIGNVWVNMQKLIGVKKEFAVSSPTATAAIRGTVFHMKTHDDSSTDVSVHQGKVSVGPSAALKSRLGARKKVPTGLAPGEVPGPEEIPGPYEVSLDQWRMIVAGQMLSVRKDGKFSQEPFTKEQAERDDFVKKNLALDEELGGEQESKDE